MNEFEPEEIINVFNKRRGVGNFSQPVDQLDGRIAIQTFSHAAGVAALHWRHQYAKELQAGVPDWLALVHPLVCSELCQIAIGSGRLLPKEIPRTKNSESQLMK